MVSVTFHGASGVVTGSCFEVRTTRGAVLVDCGMFQGTKSVKALNYEPLPFDPKSIGAVVLTHAHVDHCGLIPKLVRAGFRGPIVATPPTADLLTYVLPDSGYIQEMEVERLNRRNRQRGRDMIEPIYTREDAEHSLRKVIPRPMNEWIDLGYGIRIRFWDAAHILGSASVEMIVEDQRAGVTESQHLLFSGDIGPGEKALQGTPQAPSDVDYLFMESTYGDRVRTPRTIAQRRDILKKEIKTALAAGGNVLIPSFAIERTQELLVDLDALFNTGALPVVPIFVDSPLANRATTVFAKYLGLARDKGGSRALRRKNLRYIDDAAQSRNLNRISGGAIIMAGSGMCDAGRIRFHLKNNLSRRESTVLLVGYQAPGSLGRVLVDGAPMVRIHGEEIAVRARIRKLDEYSGHADQRGLVKWATARLPVRRNLFLIHGEDEARSLLGEQLVAAGIDASLIRKPVLGETVELGRRGARTRSIRARVDVGACATADWHNQYAETVLALRKKLDALGNDQARSKLLGRLQSALANGFPAPR